VTGAGICVIVPAFNARRTIARAVASALAEPEVTEVFVVDDASGDGTADVARSADDGTGRLRVEALARNQGPSTARNYAIARSHSPMIAILDSDDYFLPGRFGRLLRDVGSGWDLAADNVLFVPSEMAADSVGNSAEGLHQGRTRALTLIEFISGNISRPLRPRGELGFMKPLIRREALERLDLAYDAGLRLGEDYRLYAEALLRGARFTLTERAGYVAVVRADSLSGSHRKADLEALAAADRDLLEEAVARDCDRKVRTELQRHQHNLHTKIMVRAFLQQAAERGRWRAVARIAARPVQMAKVAAQLVLDRVAPRLVERPARVLFPTAMFEAAG